MPDAQGASPQSSQLDRLTLERLACPVCFGALRLAADGGIACMGCGRIYPLIDGIPVLIADRATIKP
jgi:uncharacterized protein YbaR (Trm112 family)